ncbi:pantoate--beta-alanine ligase [Arcanobacterium bovis]|uniref:Pantothenate synthetase n=1 Tax=Arcanobacterium bovis TaxID=2529275 RepID=A0A4Q9UZU8_9ACTO|nr:pantoate--beta-alanine ligase [Arcanobacterium bovis]TBW21492.1 pantoate--beta-alanine ligase [Arcanobacterium bovis]
MHISHTKSDLSAYLKDSSGSRALVMTMGALHEGHLALVREARKTADTVVVSIYVNPLQFGPNEDFDAYPRDLDADLALLEPAGVDVVFAPSDDEMYPREPLVRIEPGPVATMLEGKTRPGHFAGVLQVVHKVFNMVQPDIAYFGQKDAQQLALIRTMVADLDMPVEIRAVPIQREKSGLALSSRNAYLTDSQRANALALSQALKDGVRAGEEHGTIPEIIRAAVADISENPKVKLDYLTLVDPQTFMPLQPDFTGTGLLVVAAWVGTTRLIDNMEVSIG